MFLSNLFGNSDTTNWLLAIATILVIAGAPFIEHEMNRCVEGFFKNSLVKKIVVFSAIYLNTKDFYVSVFTTIMYAIIVDVILARPLDDPNAKLHQT